MSLILSSIPEFATDVILKYYPTSLIELKIPGWFKGFSHDMPKLTKLHHGSIYRTSDDLIRYPKQLKHLSTGHLGFFPATHLDQLKVLECDSTIYLQHVHSTVEKLHVVSIIPNEERNNIKELRIR